MPRRDWSPLPSSAFHEADLHVGDMHDLPWEDDSFDVVTSFRGIWGTTPEALAEARRVLVPGGRIGFTVWGHIKKSPGAWALSPFRLASEPKVEHQAAMVALGRPGAGEELLARHGFVDVERMVVPFAWEFADPAAYARALACMGPAYEAIQSVGEEEFVRRATEVAEEHVRDGLPLRAEIDVVGYLARSPQSDAGAWPYDTRSGSFLPAPGQEAAVRRLYDDDAHELGYVMNASRMWGHQPRLQDELSALINRATEIAGLGFRDRGILMTATASTLGDAYCSLAWGNKLSGVASGALAGTVLAGGDEGLTPRETALARWARRVTRDPNATTTDDVDELRAAGFDDAEILALTLYIGLRIAFSTVNDALGRATRPRAGRGGARRGPRHRHLGAATGPRRHVAGPILESCRVRTRRRAAALPSMRCSSRHAATSTASVRQTSMPR